MTSISALVVGGATPTSVEPSGAGARFQLGRSEVEPRPLLGPDKCAARRAEPLLSLEGAWDRVGAAQRRLEALMERAQAGTPLSARELLSMQVGVYGATQELELAGRLVEKATGAVRQVLQTQL